MDNTSLVSLSFPKNSRRPDLWKKVMEFIFPAFCLSCNREGAYACYDCLKKVTRLKAQTCPLCRKSNLDGNVCALCNPDDCFLDQVLAVGPLHENSALQKWIHAFKYDFIEDLATPLGDLLFELFEGASESFHGNDFTLCPVPLHFRRLRFRGFNQSILLLERLRQRYLEKYGIMLRAENLLERTSFQKPQMELSRGERLSNVENVFMVRPYFGSRLSRSNILLIDDVATTLATLNSCAKVLKLAGASKVSAVVLARA